jgi:DNA replication protein DnaC
MTNEQLIAAIETLKLGYLADSLPDFIQLATKKRMSPIEIVEYVVQKELEERGKKTTESRLKAARLGRYKPHADFDWNWPRKIPRSQIEQLFNLDFVEEPANVFFISSAGLGKTMLAKNLAYQAILAGHTARFVEAGDLLSDLGSQETPRALKRTMAKYLRPKLLVLDELGYLSYSARSADLIFQIINQRYEKSATIVTTNKPFKEWDTVFPGSGCVTALIDRATHHAEIIVLEGDSYRRYEASKRKKHQKRKDVEDELK